MPDQKPDPMMRLPTTDGVIGDICDWSAPQGMEQLAAALTEYGEMVREKCAMAFGDGDPISRQIRDEIRALSVEVVVGDG